MAHHPSVYLYIIVLLCRSVATIGNGPAHIRTIKSGIAAEKLPLHQKRRADHTKHNRQSQNQMAHFRVSLLFKSQC